MDIQLGARVRVAGNIRGQGQHGVVEGIRDGLYRVMSQGRLVTMAAASDLVLSNPLGINQHGGPGDWKNEKGGPGGDHWGTVDHGGGPGGSTHGPKDVERVAGIVSRAGGDQTRESTLAHQMAKSIDTPEKAQARADAAHAADLPHIAKPFEERAAKLEANNARTAEARRVVEPPTHVKEHVDATAAHIDKMAKGANMAGASGHFSKVQVTQGTKTTDINLEARVPPSRDGKEAMRAGQVLNRAVRDQGYKEVERKPDLMNPAHGTETRYAHPDGHTATVDWHRGNQGGGYPAFAPSPGYARVSITARHEPKK